LGDASLPPNHRTRRMIRRATKTVILTTKKLVRTSVKSHGEGHYRECDRETDRAGRSVSGRSCHSPHGGTKPKLMHPRTRTTIRLPGCNASPIALCSDIGPTFHLPMVQRRYVTTPPGLLLCYGHHDNRPLEVGASSEMAYFGEGSHQDDSIHRTSQRDCPKICERRPS
jgi:hypothetical protein